MLASSRMHKFFSSKKRRRLAREKNSLPRWRRLRKTMLPSRLWVASNLLSKRLKAEFSLSSLVFQHAWMKVHKASTSLRIIRSVKLWSLISVNHRLLSLSLARNQVELNGRIASKFSRTGKRTSHPSRTKRQKKCRYLSVTKTERS